VSLVLGITGSIATGKSTVVAIFKKAGYPIVDGDVIARKIVQPGEPALQKIAATFGHDFLTAEGELNRQKLGNLIFTNQAARHQLDDLLAPYLRAAFRAEIAAAKQVSSLVIVDIPLLFEQQYQEVVEQIAVVYVPESVQLERLMQRNHLTKADAVKRMNSQMSVEIKKAQADIVFDNRGTLAQTEGLVKTWLKKNNY
jgi:dephospho-CoA kinase